MKPEKQTDRETVECFEEDCKNTVIKGHNRIGDNKHFCCYECYLVWVSKGEKE